jgi:hypothetical protein
LGVPTTTVTDETSVTSLAFTLSSGLENTFYAILPENGNGRLQNAFALTTSSTGLSCSFQGGCLYSVSGTEGFTTLLKAAPADNYIKVCERKCTFDESSTAGETKCVLPSLPTTYSNTNFEIEPVSENLNSGIYFGADSAKLAFDGSIYTVPSETSSSGVIGMQFLPGFVGLISQVKYFIGEIPADRARYVDNVAFEGSLDGETYTELFRADRNVHEGWNYYNWDDSYPQYRFYRFRGLGGLDGPVRINEVVLTGTEVINNEDASYDCVAELVMKGEANVELAKPTYATTHTPVLTSMNPRYGSVVGGESVTFTGTGFSTTASDNEIIIDGIACVPSSATSTSVTCVLGKRPGLPDKALSISVAGKGLAATKGQLFYYV